ncbi:MAG: hypothetical protein NVV68_05730 [Dokdonella sp.]|nr:hypothetical protein [Dokdonella sp.]
MGEEQVADAEERAQPGRLDRRAEPGGRHEQHAQQAGHQQAGDQGRRDALDAARIEIRQKAAESAAPPADRRADDEAGDHEEHVDAGKAAGQPGLVQVIDDHREHRDRAQAVDMRHVRRRDRMAAARQRSSRRGVGRQRQRRAHRGPAPVPSAAGPGMMPAGRKRVSRRSMQACLTIAKRLGRR